MFHGSGWWSLLSADESKKKNPIDRQLLKRVLSYARPYWFLVLIVLILIVITSLLELIPPLLYRDLIDNVIPNENFKRLNLLALGMIGIPVLSGLIGVAERYFSARAGEGIIFDLRQEMYIHLQSMSTILTNTRSGEIISRFNNDVVGAQS
jgi:ATP-binding cassette subfamily B protein